MNKKEFNTLVQNGNVPNTPKLITHYDRDGRKTGSALEHFNRFGLKTIEYYDRDGRKRGESRETNCCNGFIRMEHFDSDGRKTGEDHILKTD